MLRWRLRICKGYPSYKAISNLIFHRANISQAIYANQDLEAHVLAMRLQVQGFEEHSPDAIGSTGGEDGSQATDRHFALQRFMMAAETAFSASPPVISASRLGSPQIIESHNPTYAIEKFLASVNFHTIDNGRGGLLYPFVKFIGNRNPAKVQEEEEDCTIC